MITTLVEHYCSVLVKQCSTSKLHSMSDLAQSPRAARTRRDIVAAAMTAWATDTSASLGQVAESAGVGRTTVNRYFSDRAQLVTAVDQECRLLFLAAVARARPGDGTGLAALQRACSEIVQLGPVLGLIFADKATIPCSRNASFSPSSLK